MRKIDFSNYKAPGISEEILKILQDNIEEAIDGVVLYENVNGNDQEIKLSNSLIDCKKALIEYKNNDGNYGSMLISNPNRKNY